MVKAYFNYLFEGPIAQYTSPQANIVCHQGLIYSVCNQYICIIRQKTGEIQRYLYKPNKNVPLRFITLEDTLLYSGYEDGQILVWDLLTHKIKMELDAHQATVSDIKLHDSVMVSAGFDTRIVVWDLISQECEVINNAHKGAINQVEIIEMRNPNTLEKDLYVLSLGRDSFLKLWRLGANQEVDLITTITEAETMVYNPNQHVAYVPTTRDEILIIRVAQHEDKETGGKRYLQLVGKIKRNVFAKVKDMKISRGILYLSTTDKQLESYQILNDKDLKARKKVLLNRQKEKQAENDAEATLNRTDEEVRVKYLKTKVLPDKCQNFVIQEETILINTGKNIYNLTQESYVIGNALGITTGLSLSHPYLAHQSHEKVKIYQAGNFNTLFTLPVDVTHCTLFKSYALLLSNQELILWDLTSNEEVLRMSEPLAKKVYGSPQGILAWGDNTLHFYSLGRDKRGGIHLNLEGEKFFTEKIIQCSYLNDIKYIVCTEDKIIQVLYSDTGKPFLSLYGHSLPIRSYDTSTDCNLLVTGSADKDIKLWNLDFGDVKKSIFAHSEAVTVVKFCKDTHYFFSGSQDGHLKYWDGDTGQLILDLEESTQMIRDIVVSSAGDYMVAGGNDTGFRVWRQTQEQVFEFEEKEKRMEKMMVEDYTKVKLKNNEEKTTYEDLKHGEEIIECLEAADKPSILLGLLEKVSPSKLKASLSFLHSKHRVMMEKYLQLLVDHSHHLELVWRVCDALQLRNSRISQKLRKQWESQNGRIRINTQAINILLQSMRENRSLSLLQ